MLVSITERKPITQTIEIVTIVSPRRTGSEIVHQMRMNLHKQRLNRTLVDTLIFLGGVVRLSSILWFVTYSIQRSMNREFTGYNMPRKKWDGDKQRAVRWCALVLVCSCACADARAISHIIIHCFRFFHRLFFIMFIIIPFYFSIIIVAAVVLLLRHSNECASTGENEKERERGKKVSKSQRMTTNWKGRSRKCVCARAAHSQSEINCKATYGSSSGSDLRRFVML